MEPVDPEKGGSESVANDGFQTNWAAIQKEGIDVLINFLMTGVSPHPSITDASGREKIILYSNNDYADLYTRVYDMSTKGKEAKLLYQNYRKVVQNFCANQMAPLMVEASKSSDSDEYLEVISDCLHKQQVFVTWLHHIFYYLDRFHVTLAGVDNLKTCSSKIWANDYLLPAMPRLLYHISCALEKDRSTSLITNFSQDTTSSEQETKTQQHIKNITTALMEFSAYNENLLSEYRERICHETRKFYSHLSVAKLETLTISEYLQLVQKIIEAETYRTTHWLLGDVTLSTQVTINQVMVLEPLKTLLGGMQGFLEKDSLTDLTTLYDLVVNRSHEKKGAQEMAEIFKNFLINQKGMVLLQEKQNRLTNPNMRAKPIARLDVNSSGPTGPNQSAAVDASVPISLVNPDIGDYTFITQLMELHNKYARIIDQCFCGDFNFKRQFKESFSYIMNHSIGGVHMACYLSTCCDRLIRHVTTAGPMPTTQHEVISDCNDLVNLFTYLTSKDLFEHVYRSQLAKRLLGCDELPNETEKLFVSTFKKVCGHSYSHKIESMLLDVQNSFDLIKQFKQERNDSQNQPLVPGPDSCEGMTDDDLKCPLTGDFTFTVQVLTTGTWPQTSDVTMKLPKQLTCALQQFRQWYDTKTANRKLIWNQSVSQALLQANLQRPYIVVCNMPQAILLLQFNKTDLKSSDRESSDQMDGGSRASELLSYDPSLELPTFTTNYLETATGIDPVNTRRYLKSIYVRYALIEKVGDDSFKLNMKFECASRRFKLPLPVDGESHAKSNIEEDRSLSIQACIIRIMKTRQRCTHQALVSECLSQLSMFHPSMKQIKQQIERSIERDLISRSEADPEIYEYECGGNRTTNRA